MAIAETDDLASVGHDSGAEAAERAAIEAVPERYRVNLDELAALLDKSTNTLRSYIKQFPADPRDPTAFCFPILSAGTHGRSYVFDARAVRAFFDELVRRDRAAAEQRKADVNGLRLELFGGQVADDDAELARLTPSEQKIFLQGERLAIELRKQRGELCQAAEVEDAAAAWAAAVQQEVMIASTTIAADLELDREGLQLVERALADALRRAASVGRKALVSAGVASFAEGASDAAD